MKNIKYSFQFGCFVPLNSLLFCFLYYSNVELAHINHLTFVSLQRTSTHFANVLQWKANSMEEGCQYDEGDLKTILTEAICILLSTCSLSTKYTVTLDLNLSGLADQDLFQLGVT